MRTIYMTLADNSAGVACDKQLEDQRAVCLTDAVPHQGCRSQSGDDLAPGRSCCYLQPAATFSHSLCSPKPRLSTPPRLGCGYRAEGAGKGEGKAQGKEGKRRLGGLGQRFWVAL